MLKAVKSSECSLHLLGDVNASMEDIAIQATAFITNPHFVSVVMTFNRDCGWHEVFSDSVLQTCESNNIVTLGTGIRSKKLTLTIWP